MTSEDTQPDGGDANTLSRRGLLGVFGGGAAGAAIAAGAVYASTRAQHQEETPGDLIYDFDGKHQAGIVTPAQDRMHFAAFDLTEKAERDDVIELLQKWTKAARRLTMGGDVTAKGAFGGGELFPPDDSGEAVDLSASGLTLTFGFGRTLFTDEKGKDRFGLKKHMPEEFAAMPVMVNDFINAERSHGDLCVQACADDPQVAVHAIRNLTRIAVGTARLRWSQLGFGRTSSTTQDQKTPRNLFGQKDGTANIKAEDGAALDEHVWISSGPTWTHGGSYLVARRINMTIEVWDTLQLGEQERVTGRDKAEGAPLTGGGEFSEPDFTAKDERGRPVIDERSHVFRVHPKNNGGVRMLRRGYNFVDGNDEQGRLDAGLFFIAFVNSPERFARVHKNMARDDLFVEYLKTTATGTYLVPPGVSADQYIGQGLFESN